MLVSVQDHSLPPDHEAFVAADPPTGRIIIIAPTRAACETIEIALTLDIETYLSRTYGDRVRELARSGKGFGIVAGTGTGKTLAVRPIAEEILRAPLRVGVVNREREATPELPLQNVVIVTTGIARRWFQDGDILSRDTLVIDEIHQTSAELELCLALGKRVGCRFIWLSATVDPTFYREYLGSADVLEVYSFDPTKAAQVRVVNRHPRDFLDDRFLGYIAREKRGVGVFLPTRAGVEGAALEVKERDPDLHVAFYHGGEPVRTIRPFLEDEGAPKPFLLTMTAAGQSALNVRGLDTVVIDDTRFANVISQGRNVLTRLNLGPNEMLQMAGRVHGRVENGNVWILSDRYIDFPSLRPIAPEFQLAGDSERVALTCADLGVRADELDLPIRLDRASYRRALRNLQGRGLITESGRLSRYGKTVEALPVDRAWAELLVSAEPDLVPYLAVMSSIESLHRMTREENNIDGLIVSGSDHLTSYNLYAEAFEHAGFIGEVYGLPRHIFEPVAVNEWAQGRGVLVKAIEDAALAMAGALRALNLPLPKQMPLVTPDIARRFRDLLARLMPLDLVIDEHTAEGQDARVSKDSVCGDEGAIAGTIRYFADRTGQTRAAIEGTNLRLDLIRRYAKVNENEFVYDTHTPANPLILKHTVEYFGFILESGTRPLKEFPPQLAPAARRALAEALAAGEATHMTSKATRAAVDEIRELYRRSGGKTKRLGFPELAALYETQLNQQNITSLSAFRNAELEVHVSDFASDQQRAALWSLPSQVKVARQPVAITYDLEPQPDSSLLPIARLMLPEKLARRLAPHELPKLDRPLRFAVLRTNHDELHASTLEELHRALDAPRPRRESDDAEEKQPHDVSRARATKRPNAPSHGAIGRGKAGRSKPPRRGKR
ncbi:DEAD/DEAH box helicase [bacterium]|nr:MAG: DEAD/DEAH box helicase [bacterium]